MFIDPESAMPFEDVLQIVWKRDPEMHRRVKVIAALTGRTVEDIVREVRDRMQKILETDGQERDAFLDKCEWKLCPYGLDPLLQSDEED